MPSGFFQGPPRSGVELLDWVHRCAWIYLQMVRVILLFDLINQIFIKSVTFLVKDRKRGANGERGQGGGVGIDWFIIIFLTETTMASVGVGRKPLRIITHQENNSALTNKQIFTPVSHGKKPLLSKKKSATLCSEEKRKARQADCPDREQSENKQGRGETAEWVERQGQSRQNYFLRKTVMALYRLFERTHSRWNLDELGYGHLLRIMQELGYLRAVKGGEDLKRCYWLWINLSQGRSFSLVNLLIALFCLEQLECDPQLIADIVAELGKGIAKFELEGGGEDRGKFIFLVRNERFRMEEGVLRVGREEAEKIQRQLRELRLNKLMQGKCHEGRESEEEARPVAISKRSQQLAEHRRQQMASEIRQKEPHVQEIMLHHLLSYRPAKCTASSQGACQQARHAKTDNCIQSHSYLLEEGSSQQSKEIPVVVPAAEFSKTVKKPAENPQAEETGELKQCSKIESRQSQESFQFWQSEELLEEQGGVKQIVEELEWEEIPRAAEEESLQRLAREEFLFDPPLSHAFARGEEQQRKRKEYLDLPILFVDVNIEEGRKERIVIYEGDQARELALDFGRKHGLTREMMDRLEGLLELQIGSVLTKIDEANEEDCSQLY